MDARFDAETAEMTRRETPIRPRSHVLIIDDHAPSLALCASYCDLFDHTTEGVDSAGEAVSALRRGSFGVVVLNVHPAAGGALETVRAIRALPAPAGVTPIIGLTATGRDEEAQGWLLAGLAAVLAKPITASQLFSALGDALDGRVAETRSWAPSL